MELQRGRIDTLVEQLPEAYQAEVFDFVEFLLLRAGKRLGGKPVFSWAGALKDLKSDRTSVELQREIAGWRAGEL